MSLVFFFIIGFFVGSFGMYYSVPYIYLPVGFLAQQTQKLIKILLAWLSPTNK